MVGAIDGCLIPISTPKVIRWPNVIALQGVCNSKKQFIDVDIGTVESVHDASGFSNSVLKGMIYDENMAMFPDYGHMLSMYTA